MTRTGTAVLKKDFCGILRLDGSERVSWLQGMVSNDVKKVAPGQGCYAAHLSPQGRTVAQMVILKDDDCLWLELERSVVQPLAAAFDKLLIMEDVQVSDVSETILILGLVGPGTKSLLEGWLGEPLALEVYGHRQFAKARVVRTELGHDVWVAAERGDATLAALVEAGASPIDAGSWDVVRTEAGLPVYGVDMDETTILPELGERGISYDKGCYVGQEVVAKVKYIGHVNRRLVGLVLDGDLAALPKSPIRQDGKELGYVTTSVVSPGLEQPIALGYVSRAANAPGTAVEVVSGGVVIIATIVELPFVKAAD